MAIIYIIMAKRALTLPAHLVTQLQQLGENLRLARLRRHFTAAIVAERADISRPTLRAIENGSPTVALGAYASVLFSLGFEKELGRVAMDDTLGRRLQDAKLEVRKRAPRQSLSHKTIKDSSRRGQKK